MIKIASDVLDWNNPKLCKLRFPRWTHTEVYEKYHITLGGYLELWLTGCPGCHDRSEHKSTVKTSSDYHRFMKCFILSNVMISFKNYSISHGSSKIKFFMDISRNHGYFWPFIWSIPNEKSKINFQINGTQNAISAPGVKII